MNTQDQLAVIIKESNLEKSVVETLMTSYSKYFNEAKSIVTKCKDIEVISEDQTDLMKKAREARLKLKDIRVDADKTRIKLKAQSLREGNAIQGIYNVIKALIIPVEEHLEKQEKFAEVREMARREKQLESRIEKLSKYVLDVSLYGLKDMEDEVFNNLLAGCKLSWGKAKKEEEEAEAKRIADEKAEAERQEEIRLENIKLKKQSEEKEKELEVWRQNQAEKLRKANEAKEKAEAKLVAEKAETLRREAEKKAVEEAKKKEAEEAERVAVLAPDKIKLVAFADNIDEFIGKYPPALKSEPAQKILNEAEKLLKQASEVVKQGVKIL